jgi:hypothetical protein
MSRRELGNLQILDFRRLFYAWGQLVSAADRDLSCGLIHAPAQYGATLTL